MEDNFYRRGVGVMLVNGDGKVFVAARVDNPDDAWQMPQGGIDADEEAWPAALRELEEETGITPNLVELIAECPERLRYEIPEQWRPKHWARTWKGQIQHWFLARYLGNDEEIDLDTEHPEFRAWKWVEPAAIPELIVPFKRDLYRRLLEDFSEYL